MGLGTPETVVKCSGSGGGLILLWRVMALFSLNVADINCRIRRWCARDFVPRLASPQSGGYRTPPESRLFLRGCFASVRTVRPDLNTLIHNNARKDDYESHYVFRAQHLCKTFRPERYATRRLTARSQQFRILCPRL